ncbi:MAG: hypothetical protein Q4G03_06560 [Planctomycetia bacterium]|nr:hypothetical protein [Planctomycetia bacterium]
MSSSATVAAELEGRAGHSCCRQIVGYLVEVLLIFLIFALYGAWPTPDVNEQYYVGKAIHFWNRAWLANDPFLNTPDSHWLFYACFGFFSYFFDQNVLVWFGRLVAWLSMAIAWRGLSYALLPRRGIAILTAAAFAFYLETYHMAGEWIFGGVEGKALSFPFVFWGLACFVKGQYNRAWILYGIGSAFHALVGGWAVLASLFAWFACALLGLTRDQDVPQSPPLKGFARLGRAIRNFFKTMAPGLLLGGALSLLGVIPALRLDAGATAEQLAQSREIYVFDRLAHHLVASSLPWTYLTRFALLTTTFVLSLALVGSVLRVLQRVDSQGSLTADLTHKVNARYARLVAFVFGAILIALIGVTLDWGAKYLASIGRLSDYRQVAGALRYYWYRLSDWAVPLGVVFVSARGLLASFASMRAYFTSQSSCKLYNLTLFWFACLIGLYWCARFYFCRLALRIAQTQMVEGSIPMPRPTESVSFMTALALTAVVLLLLLTLGFAWRLMRRGDALSRGDVAPLTLVGTTVWLIAITTLAPAWRLAQFIDLRATVVAPRSAPPKDSIAQGWLDACHWVREHTDANAVFLVPRGCDSFKWEARRAEAGSWKEIPQDARSIVAWHEKMEQFYANPGAAEDSPMRWNQALVVVFINKGRAQVEAESKLYGFDYAIVEAPPYTVATVPEALRRWNEFRDADQVYQNEQFVVLRFNKESPLKEDASAQ